MAVSRVVIQETRTASVNLVALAVIQFKTLVVSVCRTLLMVNCSNSSNITLTASTMNGFKQSKNLMRYQYVSFLH